MEWTKQYSIGNENSYSYSYKFGAFVQLCHLHISLIGQPGFVFFLLGKLFSIQTTSLCCIFIS